MLIKEADMLRVTILACAISASVAFAPTGGMLKLRSNPQVAGKQVSVSAPAPFALPKIRSRGSLATSIRMEAATGRYLSLGHWA